MDWLEEEIKDISNELPPSLRYNFQKCVDDIKNGNYRHLRGSDDALSAVIQTDSSCRNCREIENQNFRDKIDNCIQLLIEYY